MALHNTSLADSFLPGAVETSMDGGAIDVTQVVDELLASLHAGSRAELVFWTEAQLYQWMDEAVKRLAAIAALFVGRNSGLTVPATATYSLPNQLLATLHVSVDQDAIRPANTMELEARDDSYQTTEGTPDAWYQDLLGAGVLGLAPVPDEEIALAEIYTGWPTALDAGQTMLAAPPPIKGYLAMYALGEAYGIEGEMEMPEVAAHCRGRLELYHQLFRAYYGPGI
jgi:hypothetical protein